MSLVVQYFFFNVIYQSAISICSLRYGFVTVALISSPSPYAVYSSKLLTKAFGSSYLAYCVICFLLVLNHGCISHRLFTLHYPPFSCLPSAGKNSVRHIWKGDFVVDDLTVTFGNGRRARKELWSPGRELENVEKESKLRTISGIFIIDKNVYLDTLIQVN